jgi:hypothetical protein
MAMTRPRWLCFLFVVSTFVLASCASAPPPGPSSAEIAGTKANTVALSPFNVVSPLPPELAGSIKIVSTALVEYLESQGKKVYVLGFRGARDLWKQSTKEVRELGLPQNFKNAARIYAHKIGEQLDYDVIIVPSIFVQNAKKKRSRTVRWDGAEQRLEYRGDSRAVAVASIYVKAASLFVQVLDREGEAIHTKRAGLELIQHLQFGGERVKGFTRKNDSEAQLINSWELVNDAPPIKDEAMVWTGVAAAFSPFLPELKYRNPVEEID